MAVVRSGVMLAAIWLAGLGPAHAKAPLDELLSHDGLAKVSVKGIELAYVRPGATLAGYAKVMLDPVEVAFRKDWDPQRTGSLIKLSSAEREDIRARVAALVAEEFAGELQKAGRYPIVTAAGPDVLRFKAHVVNLYITAPDTRTAGRSRTYTQSAGEMTLFAELIDSETGQVIARVVDREESYNAGRWMLADSWQNANEARLIASRWARILRSGLDKAHGIGKP